MASTGRIESSIAVRAAAWLSDGIRLCVDDGPASGTMMGYACRNQAGGRGLVGRWVDRRFLNYAGWEGVRQRRRALQTLIARAVNHVHADGVRPVQLLDLAGGTSDYVLDALSQFPVDAVTATCVDADHQSVHQGRARADSEGRRNIRFEGGDATDLEVLQTLVSRPDIVVCSGFYELLTDDDAVRSSMDLVARLLPPGGRFVLSHQVDRPMPMGIDRLIWKAVADSVTMQMRSADQIGRMLAAAGFIVEETTSAADLYGLFLARRT